MPVKKIKKLKTEYIYSRVKDDLETGLRPSKKK